MLQFADVQNYMEKCPDRRRDMVQVRKLTIARLLAIDNAAVASERTLCRIGWPSEDYQRQLRTVLSSNCHVHDDKAYTLVFIIMPIIFVQFCLLTRHIYLSFYMQFEN